MMKTEANSHVFTHPLMSVKIHILFNSDLLIFLFTLLAMLSKKNKGQQSTSLRKEDAVKRGNPYLVTDTQTQSWAGDDSLNGNYGMSLYPLLAGRRGKTKHLRALDLQEKRLHCVLEKKED